MNPTEEAATPSMQHPASVEGALRRVQWLWAVAGVVSGAALTATAILAVVRPDEVTWVMWLRGVVVTIACFAFVVVSASAARGSRGAYSRMRIVATIAPLGIVALIVAPDDGYPVWMKVEQGVLGALIGVIALTLWNRSVRKAFAVSDIAGQR